MGSIRKRNSQWNAQVRIKGWRSLSKTFATKQLAKACQLDFNNGNFQFNGLVMYDYTVAFNMRLTL